MKNYTIQSISPGDENKLIELLQIVPESWPPFDLQFSPLEHWYWRYRDNPSKLTMITVAKDGHEIVGCLHSIPRRIKIGDNILLGCCSQGFVVDPEYRRFGIGNKLELLIDNLRPDVDIAFSYFESGNPFYLRALKKRRHYFPVLLTHFVRIKDIKLHLKMTSYKKKWVIHIAFRCLKIINQVHNFMNYYNNSKNSIHVQDINRFDTRIDKFWDKVSSDYKLISERTKEYMNWRYCDSRGGDYSVKCIQNEDNIFGYIILRINKMEKNYPVGYIVDMLTLPERPDIN
ncbi:MAG: GNAT family N-acetyltransferase, partial [Desulfobacterales bacterium]|nr:GNAT family N-acetyltransferase [Desulfobacterales bacterium]